MKTKLLSYLLLIFPATVFAYSTSPNPLPANNVLKSPLAQIQLAADASEIITFSP